MKHRLYVSLTNHWWRKPHPWYFARRYGDGARTLQIMFIDIWIYPRRKNK